MRRLFKFPPVEDAHVFIERALELRRLPRRLVGARLDPPSSPNSPSKDAHKKFQTIQYSKPNNSSYRQSMPPQSQPPLLGVDIGKVATNAVRTILGDQEYQTKLEEEVASLKSSQMHLSNRLERIIYSLQHNVLPEYVVLL